MTDESDAKFCIEVYEFLITLEFIPENYIQIEQLVSLIINNVDEKSYFIDYLTKVREYFWKPFLIERLCRRGYTTNGIFSMKQIRDDLKKSVDLGNPYSLVDLDRNCKNDRSKFEDCGKAFEMGCPYGLLSQISIYFEIDRILHIEEHKLDQKGKEDLRERVLNDLEKIKDYKSRYILSEIIDIYRDLIIMSNKLKDTIKRKYYEELYKQLRYKDKEVLEILKLKAELKQVKRSYEELKVMKTLDFNNILGKEVGEFL